MNWNELKAALDDVGRGEEEIFALIGDQYIPIELVITPKGRVFFVPTMEDSDVVEQS